MANTHITILGDGAMATACAILLARKPEHRVRIWSQFPEHVLQFTEAGQNTLFLPGVPIPPEVGLSADIDEAADRADVLLVAVPMVYLRQTLEPIAPRLNRGRPAISVIKGIENGTYLRASQVITEVLGDRPVCALSGPSHAEEISRGKPASLVAASSDTALAEMAQRMLGTERLRIYTNRDIVGVEWAAAVKNVLAIAAGICDGLELGDNAKAALMTRGIVEMTRFGIAMGSHAPTFAGLAGIGDLITTCVSPFGRNRGVGEAIGKGKKLKDILSGMQQVAEGIWTSRAIHEMAEQRGVEMPIVREVYQMLFHDKDPLQAVSDLMLRAPRSESDPQPAEG